ncbi:MAG: DUF3604 domain-containing protein [Armatimonadota bacterium]|nr:DUF3604 domain-containing protein [Armatimonadota bacterium]
MPDDAPRLTTATVDPPTAMAGVRDAWRITFAGLQVAEGGLVRLRLAGGRDNKSDWTRPQAEDPGANEYVTASCSGDAQLSVCVPPFSEESSVVVDMAVAGAPLAAEDETTVVLGDTAGGGDGSTPQTFSQPAKPFDVFVAEPPAEDEEPDFRRAEGAPTVDVTGGPMDRLRIIAPATVPAGSRFSIAIKAEDVHGNVASLYQGELELEITEENVTGPQEAEFAGPGGGVITVEGFKAFSRGPVRIIATDKLSEIKYVSNPILVTKHDQAQLYFGVIHGHTHCSDGTGSVRDYYACMRDDNRLDFGAVGDHDHDYETGEKQWRQIQEVTAESNEPGRFVTLLGYEWAKWRRNGAGDRNVYYDADHKPMYRSGDEHYPTPPELFEALDDHRAIVIPHHSASVGNFCDWSDHDPEKERLVEIYSVWGSSECSVHDGNPFPMRPTGLPARGFADVPMDSGEAPEGFVQRGLAMGRRLGFVGGGDDHLGHPGDPIASGAEPFRYRDGLMGVWAPELTRQAIFQAMYDRHTYATTGARMIVLFRVAGAFMGDEIELAERPELTDARTVEAFIAGETKLSQVEVVRNNEVVHTQRLDDPQFSLEWVDEEPPEPLALTHCEEGEPEFVFYYLRVLQSDGQMGWASPVWILL